MRRRTAVCYAMRDSGRSRHVARSMVAGLQRHGWDARVSIGYNGVESDLAIGYGWLQRRIFDAYAAAGRHYLYVDMGYWHRKPKEDPRNGHHKVSLDGWCPAAHMRRGMPDDRFKKLNVPVLDTPRTGSYVLLAGMSAKSAQDHGYKTAEWETAAIKRITKVSARQIVYRPKPSWDGAKPLVGARMDDVSTPIEAALLGAHALVTRHSNTAVDALVAGVPYYCEAGVAQSLAMPSIDLLETAAPASVPERLSLLADIAYLQWTPFEMASGACFDYYKGQL